MITIAANGFDVLTPLRGIDPLIAKELSKSKNRRHRRPDFMGDICKEVRLGGIRLLRTNTQSALHALLLGELADHALKVLQLRIHRLNHHGVVGTTVMRSEITKTYRPRPDGRVVHDPWGSNKGKLTRGQLGKLSAHLSLGMTNPQER